MHQFVYRNKTLQNSFDFFANWTLERFYSQLDIRMNALLCKSIVLRSFFKERRKSSFLVGNNEGDVAKNVATMCGKFSLPEVRSSNLPFLHLCNS